MGDVDCNGSEDKIQDCPHKDFHELPSHCSSLENRVEIAIACEHSAYSIGIVYEKYSPLIVLFIII